MSRPTLSKAIEVVEAARNAPDLYGDLLVYAYFNNDGRGNAVRNADKLRRQLEK